MFNFPTNIALHKLKVYIICFNVEVLFPQKNTANLIWLNDVFILYWQLIWNVTFFTSYTERLLIIYPCFVYN